MQLVNGKASECGRRDRKEHICEDLATIFNSKDFCCGDREAREMTSFTED